VPIASASGEPEGLALILRDVSAEVRLQERFKALLCSERARADELEQRVGERTRDLTAALAEVTRLSRTDPLTGLLNRRAMADRIRRAIALGPPRPELGVGLLMTDLDHFKRINDTFGHEAGDTVLVAVANILVDVAGESDAVARFGGEEFVLLLQDATLESLRQTGERCNAAVRTLALGTLIDHANGALTISVGAAIFPTHAGSFEEILLKADRALYAAKGRGRDRTVVWSDLEHASAR
jgi:diguanylate cyclase (GGDEF)-like protein